LEKRLIYWTSSASVYDAGMADSTAGPMPRWLMEHALAPVGIAVVFVLVALLWTFPLQHVIAYPFVFLFFGAIMGSAWFGGMVAGFVAVALSSLLVGYFFIPPLYSMSIGKESQSFFTAFILCAIAITVVSSARKRAESAVRIARDELEERVSQRTAELEQSNREILESDRQLRQLTEAIPQQIWRADALGNVEYCNGHLLAYLGTPAPLVLGESFFGIFHPLDELIIRGALRGALESKNTFEAEVRVHSAAGSYRWFLVRAVPQMDGEGAVARWYGIHIDIEEQRRAQQSLAEAQDEQSRISHLLSLAEMAASIAHELNQPITAVVTHASACREWLREDAPNIAKASATAEKIVQESARASAVVSRVRALFRKDAQTCELTVMNGLIRGVERLLREESIRRDVNIRLILADESPRLKVDPVQIQQVLLNLAMNGMDAMSEIKGPRNLTIRLARKNDDEALISIEDQGPGIPEDISERIFQPFFTTKPHGTGMGLAICRSIIEMHDGRIWAENGPRGGAIFHFTVRTQA
jgi:PAS domain S-box-containing protein